MVHKDKVKPTTWKWEEHTYYVCKKCKGSYLIENYDVEKFMCSKCIKKINEETNK